MTEKDYRKGNLLLSYLFNTDDVISNLDSEITMKKELQELMEQWKQRGLIKRYMIGDDELIDEKLQSMVDDKKSVKTDVQLREEDSHFPESRFRHCYMVGSVMQYIAKRYYHYNDVHAAEMFMLGFVHDSMYDYEENETLHNDVVSQLVPEKYSKDVKHHSTYQSEYESDALDMLYFADQIIDGQGKLCSFDQRITDILERHGKSDGVYQDTVDIVKYLNSNELFKDMEHDLLINPLFQGKNIVPLDDLYVAWPHAGEDLPDLLPNEYFTLLLENFSQSRTLSINQRDAMLMFVDDINRRGLGISAELREKSRTQVNKRVDAKIEKEQLDQQAERLAKRMKRCDVTVSHDLDEDISDSAIDKPDYDCSIK